MKILTAVLAISFMGIVNPVFAADQAAKKDAKSEPTADQRQKMAEMHEKIATCLRSAKPFGDCHKEMKEMMESKDGMGSCPMMMEHGKHHEHHEKSGG